MNTRELTVAKGWYDMSECCCLPCCCLCDCSLQVTDAQGKTTQAKLTWAGQKKRVQEEPDALKVGLRAVLNSHLSEPGAVVSSSAVAPVHNTMPERFDLQHTGAELKNATVEHPPPVPVQQPCNPNIGYNPNNARPPPPVQVQQSYNPNNVQSPYNPNNAHPPPVPAQQIYNPNNSDNPIHAHATRIIDPLVAMERLSKLKSLLNTGVISEEEFNLKRVPLLDAM